MFSDFTRVANEVAATTKKSVKERLVADYLATLDDASLERAVVFFSGGPFPRREQRVTGVGWATIADAVVEARSRSLDELWDIYPKYADLGDADRSRDNYLEAVVFLEERVREEPEMAMRRALLGRAYAGLGRKEDALREITRATELESISRNAVEGAAILEQTAAVLGKSGEAVKALTRRGLAALERELLRQGVSR